VAWLTGILQGDLGGIVERAIAADSANRYPTATDLAADLRRFLAGEPVETAESSKNKASRRSLNLKLFLMAAASIAAIGGI